MLHNEAFGNIIKRIINNKEVNSELVFPPNLKKKKNTDFITNSHLQICSFLITNQGLVRAGVQNEMNEYCNMQFLSLPLLPEFTRTKDKGQVNKKKNICVLVQTICSDTNKTHLQPVAGFTGKKWPIGQIRRLTFL